MTDKHHTPESSQIASIHHDKERNVLTVDFKTGSSYEYSDVPDSVFEAFKAAESKGKFLTASIKGKYDYKRL